MFKLLKFGNIFYLISFDKPPKYAIMGILEQWREHYAYHMG